MERTSRPLQAKPIEFGLPQVVQLHEIDQARRKRDEPSIGPEVQELIARLTSGGVGSSGPGKGRLPDPGHPIIVQAKRLWDRGLVREILAEDGLPQYARFSDYLASIPGIPNFPAGYDARFPHLVLVDRRIPIVAACKVLDVQFDGDASTFVPHEPDQSVRASVYWIRIQDGKLHRGHQPSFCRTEFTAKKGEEFGLEAHEGLSLYAQSPDLLEINTAMHLTGSVRADARRRSCAYLRRWTDGDVKLKWRWDDDANPARGSASRGDCVR